MAASEFSDREQICIRIFRSGPGPNFPIGARAEPAVKSPENRKFGKPGINFDFEGKPAAGVDFVRVLMQFPMVILNFLRFGYVFVLNAQD